jgi:hypothetical protein
VPLLPAFVHLTVSAGITECVDLQRIWWHQRLSAVYTGQWVRR